MSKEKLPLEEEEQSTPPEGNEPEDKGSENQVSDEQFLAKINEVEGRNYKSVEDYKKTVKHRNEEFAKQGKTKETEKKEEPVTPDLTKEILFIGNPEAKLVEEDLRIVADSKYDGNLLETYRNEPWLGEKAGALFAEKKRKEEAEGKISTPSTQIQGEKNSMVDLSDADRALMKKYNLSEEDLSNK